MQCGRPGEGQAGVLLLLPPSLQCVCKTIFARICGNLQFPSPTLHTWTASTVRLLASIRLQSIRMIHASASPLRGCRSLQHATQLFALRRCILAPTTICKMQFADGTEMTQCLSHIISMIGFFRPAASLDRVENSLEARIRSLLGRLSLFDRPALSRWIVDVLCLRLSVSVQEVRRTHGGRRNSFRRRKKASSLR